MPRVYTKTKSAAGKTYSCTKCSKPITKGQEYHEWSFRYGGTRRQHAACGRPKPSQLTQSKLAAVYEAQEAAEEQIAGAASVDDVVGALNDVAEAAREVAEEYREAVQAMNMEGSGNESEERADALEAYADELENVVSELEGEEWQAAEPEEQEEGAEPEDEEVGDKVNDDGDTEEDWLEDKRQRALEELGNLSV
jgi:hypothetical protein